MNRHVSIFVTVFCLLGGVARAQERPLLRVADPERACPGVEGTFVAILSPEQGMLLCSAAPFPGSRDLGAPSQNGTLTVTASELGGWRLTEVQAPGMPPRIWGNVYPFRNQGAVGCVGFDKQRFSSEGDLVSYLRWLTEEVYLKLDEQARSRWPALELHSRTVRLQVARAGLERLHLPVREGAPQAVRLGEEERLFILTPFVLDADVPWVAVKLETTTTGLWQAAEKQLLGWRVISPWEPATWDDAAVQVSVQGIDKDPES